MTSLAPPPIPLDSDIPHERLCIRKHTSPSLAHPTSSNSNLNTRAPHHPLSHVSRRHHPSGNAQPWYAYIVTHTADIEQTPIECGPDTKPPCTRHSIWTQPAVRLPLPPYANMARSRSSRPPFVCVRPVVHRAQTPHPFLLTPSWNNVLPQSYVHSQWQTASAGFKCTTLLCCHFLALPHHHRRVGGVAQGAGTRLLAR